MGTARVVNRQLKDRSLQIDDNVTSEPMFKEHGLEPEYFHDRMLRLHKAMHAAAIDHCRPRLRSTLSNCYKPERLMDVLLAEPLDSGSHDGGSVAMHMKMFRDRLGSSIARGEHKLANIRRVLEDAELLDTLSGR